jgi:hypothetical protein
MIGVANLHIQINTTSCAISVALSCFNHTYISNLPLLSRITLQDCLTCSPPLVLYAAHTADMLRGLGHRLLEGPHSSNGTIAHVSDRWWKRVGIEASPAETELRKLVVCSTSEGQQSAPMSTRMQLQGTTSPQVSPQVLLIFCLILR